MSERKLCPKHRVPLKHLAFRTGGGGLDWYKSALQGEDDTSPEVELVQEFCPICRDVSRQEWLRKHGKLPRCRYCYKLRRGGWCSRVVAHVEDDECDEFDPGAHTLCQQCERRRYCDDPRISVRGCEDFLLKPPDDHVPIKLQRRYDNPCRCRWCQEVYERIDFSEDWRRIVTAFDKLQRQETLKVVKR